MNIQFDRGECETIQDLIKMYPSREFASPTRSTVPLLCWLRDEPAQFCQLLWQLEMPATSTFHLEYTVRPPQGRGKPSHTDLMVMAGDASLAVEARWTEPAYPRVGKWLDGSENRRLVLDGWLRLLQPHCRTAVRVVDFARADYQMVHRAASACAAGAQPAMAYLVFTPSPDPRAEGVEGIQAGLEHFRCLLGDDDPFPFYRVEVRLSPTVAYRDTEWLKKGTDDTRRLVGAAMMGRERLFEFELPRVR